jgi:hypothetical protein
MLNFPGAVAAVVQRVHGVSDRACDHGALLAFTIRVRKAVDGVYFCCVQTSDSHFMARFRGFNFVVFSQCYQLGLVALPILIQAAGGKGGYSAKIPDVINVLPLFTAISCFSHNTPPSALWIWLDSRKDCEVETLRCVRSSKELWTDSTPASTCLYLMLCQLFSSHHHSSGNLNTDLTQFDAVSSEFLIVLRSWIRKIT